MSLTKTIRNEPVKRESYHHGDLRAALLASAETELEERGIEGFSLRSVAKRAGVSHAAPAHHFGTTTGLLTALAASAFERLVAMQRARQQLEGGDAREQLLASGLAYIDFAVEHPALFKLMFSSWKPNEDDEDFSRHAAGAFEKLVTEVGAVRGETIALDSPAMIDVMAVWAAVHGVADLMNGGRMKHLAGLSADAREEAIRAIIGRSMPAVS